MPEITRCPAGHPTYGPTDRCARCDPPPAVLETKEHGRVVVEFTDGTDDNAADTQPTPHPNDGRLGDQREAAWARFSEAHQ